jgi:hypothetical protein
MPDRDHWSASMLLCWVLTRDNNAVLSMLSDYGGSMVEGDNVTRIQPQTWDDVSRTHSIDYSLPKEERARDTVLKAHVFVIPAWEEIYSRLTHGEIDAWARPNGSGNIVKIEPIQWAGLRFHALEGHDIAAPVNTEQDPLTLPRPLADYLSGSVPRTNTPTVWPDPLFSAEQAMRVWPPCAAIPVSRAPPPWRLRQPTSGDVVTVLPPGSKEAAAQAALSPVPSNGDHSRSSAPRKRGPRPKRRQSAADQMAADVASEAITSQQLADMLEKNLADRYRVSRDTARKARRDVLGET